MNENEPTWAQQARNVGLKVEEGPRGVIIVSKPDDSDHEARHEAVTESREGADQDSQGAAHVADPTNSEVAR